MNPSLIHQLDSTLHERNRLSIAALLAEREVLSFNELKRLLQMTDGKLSVHIRTLEDRGYLVTAKVRRDGRIRTNCRLSENGRKALCKYLQSLNRLLKVLEPCAKRRRRMVDLN
jgi:DNA-binding MarR family transcriptional regulator